MTGDVLSKKINTLYIIETKLQQMSIKTAVVDGVDYRDIERDTRRNASYRRVIYTVKGLFQNVLMSLRPGETITFEKHSHTVQFVRIESGEGECIVGKKNSKTYALHDGVSITIPPGTWHKFVNTHQRKCLKLYSIYTPPEHPVDRLEQRQ